ncbi:MAG: amidohydrolase family protein [Armatimonadota bacterium]
MTEQERYQQIDLPFYMNEIAPILPEQVLDFHAHTWKNEHWKVVPWETDAAGAKYMVTIQEYGLEALISEMKMIFPDRPYNAVCFGNPTPAVDIAITNDYLSKAVSHQGLYPLAITGKDIVPVDDLKQMICDKGFYGYKVFLNWYGNDYGSVKIEDMIGPAEMQLANDMNLVVLLHVPRDGRLADPEIQAGVRALSSDYPGASIVLAHCGRAYLPGEMKNAISSIKDLPNVFFDTAMVMDPIVLQMVFDNIDSSRVLYATDFPVASMRGRRVQVMDHWVDLVLEGYPPSAYRVQSDNMRATFMAYEIVLAIRRAGEMSGLSDEKMSDVFYNNGMSVLNRVMSGSQIKRK